VRLADDLGQQVGRELRPQHGAVLGFLDEEGTRATELAETYPQHVAASWLGHSVKIASKHYWNTTEDHFKQAIGAPDAQIASPGDSVVMEDSTPQSVEAEKALLNALLQIAEMAGDDGKVNIRDLEKRLVFPTLAEDFPTFPSIQIAEAGLEPARGLLPTGF
jgi:hypothetical protein